MKVITRAEPGSPDWRQARWGRVTATRGANVLVSAIDGEYVYKSALQEYAAISEELANPIANVEPVDDFEALDDGDEPEKEESFDEERSDRMQWGIDSEPVHLKMLARDTGWTFTPEHAVIGHPVLDWLAASIDAFVSRGETAAPGVAELKGTVGYGARKWENGKQPLLFKTQTAIELVVTELLWGLLSALIIDGYRPPRVQWDVAEYDEKIHDWIIEGLTEFWNGVQRGVAPKPRATAGDIKALRSLARPQKDHVCYFAPELQEVRNRRELAKAQIKASEQIVKDCDVVLIQAIGEAELGIFDDGTGYTFKSQTRNMKAKEAHVQVIAPFLKFTSKAF
jgi:predicted phage-related endonuclease